MIKLFTDGEKNQIDDSSKGLQNTQLASKINVMIDAINNGAGDVDPTAIHKTTGNEIHALTDKPSPVGADEIVIEDSQNSWAKKKVAIANLPASSYVKPKFFAGFSANSMKLPLVNPAELKTIVGTNGNVDVLAFDDTTPEYAENIFVTPDDISTNGADLVKFVVKGFSETASSGKKVALNFFFSMDNGTTWDVGWGVVAPSDFSPSSSQDKVDSFEMSVDLTTLGWTAGKEIRFMVSRVAPSGTNLVGDYFVMFIDIQIPRA